MSEKTYNVVGVSTNAKTTKFRVANGDLAARSAVLERNGHTDIKLVELNPPLAKKDAIEKFKADHPEYANVRMPNEKAVTTKTVKINKATAPDPATAVLKDAETPVEV